MFRISVAAVCGVGLMIASSLLPGYPAQAAGLGDIVGINANNLFVLLRDPATGGKYVDLIAQTGTGWVRIPATWPQLEPAEGQYNWTQLDSEVNALRAHNLNILLNLRSTPCWALAGQIPCYGQATPQHAMGSELPDRAKWQKFLSDLVAHYRGRIAYYEIWNETNNPVWLDVAGAAPDSQQQIEGYRDNILIPAAQAIHAADPSARVVGPAYTPSMAKTAEELGQAYSVLLGGGGAQALDVVSIHIYPARNLAKLGQVVRGAMQAAGAGNKPLWLTEFGCPASGDQVGYLGFLRQNQSEHIFDKLFWYAMGDNDIFAAPGKTGMTTGRVRFGLVDDDLTPRPGYAALQNFIQSGGQ